MLQKVNKHYQELFTTKLRYVIMMGGRGAGRSTTASQYATAKLMAPEFFRCAIMRFVLTDIRNSIFQDIYDRMEELALLDSINIKEHPLIFKYGKNKINGIGFRKSSTEQKSKLKSLANYTTVIIEEADEINEEDFTQLDDSLRTLKTPVTVVLLLNPPDKNHWIIRRWFNLKPAEQDGFYVPVLKEMYKHNTVFISTTYKENIVNINKSTAENYELYKTTRPEHYWNMIRGLVSEGARGRIFKTWKTCTDEVFDSLPFDSIYALDFGFKNDPTALIQIKKHNQKIWLREHIYETGLTNPAIARRMDTLGIPKDAVIYADSAEPKSIRELCDAGWNVLPAEKGPDSIRAGVDMLLEMEVFYTELSTNIALEEQNYKWKLDKNKMPTNTPIDEWNHAMDATRYGVFTHSHQPFVGFV